MKQTIVEKKKEAVNGCYYNKTADEMFKKIGYKKQENELQIKYIEDTMVMGDSFHFEIFFSKTSKLIGIKHLLTIQELQAINKKVEELGWKKFK